MVARVLSNCLLRIVKRTFRIAKRAFHIVIVTFHIAKQLFCWDAGKSFIRE